MGWIREKRGNRDSIHRQFLLEIPQDLKGLRVDDLGAVVCSSCQHRKVLAKGNRVDFDSLMDSSLGDDLSLDVIMHQPAIIGSHKERIIVSVPQPPC